MNNLIGVFDSGIGGFSIVEKIVEYIPNLNILYYADSKNNPYGNKTDEELFEIVCGVVEYLKNEGCKMIVIACNTATTKCMKKLREKYTDLIFVGTVPAIKVACDNNFKNTLVMATPATIESERTFELVRDNKRDDQNIYLVACKGLANTIELGQKNKVDEILKNIFSEYKNKNIDSIVLGCTHYPYIKNEILEEMPEVVLLDGSLGVAKEVKRQLEINNLLSNDIEIGNVYMVNSNKM